MATGKMNKYADGNDSGWVDDSEVTDKMYTGSFFMRKQGNIVELKGMIKFTENITGASGKLIGILPNGFRPTKKAGESDTTSLVTVPVVNANYAFTMMTVSPGGGMRVFKPYTHNEWDTTHNAYFQTMYYANDD